MDGLLTSRELLGVIAEFLRLWDILEEVALQPSIENFPYATFQPLNSTQLNQLTWASSSSLSISVHGNIFGKHGHPGIVTSSCDCLP